MLAKRNAHALAWKIVSTALFIFSLLSCSPSRSPEAQRGVLDLRAWDFAARGPVSLRGTWAFSYKGAAGEMAASKDGDSFILVPSNWKGAKTNGSAAGAFGTATYRLLVRLPAPGRLSLRLGDVGTACSLYADGRLVGEVGRLGATAGTDLPDARVAYFEIEAAKTELELVLDVSSFEDSNGGGIWETPILGLPESIATLKNRHIAIEAFTSGILFSIALFYFAVFLFRRNDHALLLFAMICLCFVARQADTGERLLRLTLPGLAWLIAFRIEYLCICLPVLLYSFFFRSMFPEEYDRRLMRVLAPIGIVFSTAVIVLPPLYFTAILRFIQLYALLVIACVLYALARAAVRRREGALLFIAGIVVLFVSGSTISSWPIIRWPQSP